MKVINDKIAVSPITEKITKTKGGILIPESAQDKVEQTYRGKVIAIGDGLKDYPMKVKIGDIIVYGQYAGIKVEDLDEKVYLVMSQNEVQAILK